MTQDEIIRMAREAGIETLHIKRDGEKHSILDLCYPELERFAALVAEPWIKTNKALANEIIELKKQVDISALPIIIEAAVKEAVLAERKACAKFVDHILKEGGGTYGDAIRARGE